MNDQTTKAIVAFNSTEAALSDLTARYKGVVFDVTKPDGMQEAKSAYKDINAHSIILEKAREKEKAESLAYGRYVDVEAKRIAERLDALRLPIKTMIETETKREERERAAKVQAEADRITAEQASIKAAEEKRMAAERAEIARQQRELAAAQKSAADKIEADQRAARMRIEEADRAARQAREALELKAKAARDAEDARLKAERNKLEAAQRADEENQRRKREKEEAIAAAERLRIETAQRKEREAAESKAKVERDAEEAKQREIQHKAMFAAATEEMIVTLRGRITGSPAHTGIAQAIDAYFIHKQKAA